MNSAFIFDIDNTLTPPRQPLEGEMTAELRGLDVPFALAAGSDVALLDEQFFGPLHRLGYRGQFDAFVCNGASRYRCTYGETEFRLDPTDDFVLRDYLGPAGHDRLLAILQDVLADARFALPPELRVRGERIVERGAMVNFAPIGRPRGALTAEDMINRDRFVAFDVETGYRARLLPHLQAQFAKDLPASDLLTSYGGQTSFDIVRRGRDKSFPIRCLLNEGFDQVTYFGDALFPGGNDAAVLDFQKELGTASHRLAVVPVDSYRATLALLRARRKAV